jgi:hypothetical protein
MQYPPLIVVRVLRTQKCPNLRLHCGSWSLRRNELVGLLVGIVRFFGVCFVPRALLSVLPKDTTNVGFSLGSSRGE